MCLCKLTTKSLIKQGMKEILNGSLGSMKGSLRIQRNLSFHTYPQIQKVFTLQCKAINATFNDRHLKYHIIFTILPNTGLV